MKLRLGYLILILLCFSCLSKEARGKQEAKKYMERYQFRMEMFMEATDKFVSESARITKHRMGSSSDPEANRNDSLKLADLLTTYQIATGTVKTHIQGMVEYREFDLRKPGMKFVEDYSSVITENFYPTLFEFRPGRSEAQLKEASKKIGEARSRLNQLDEEQETLQRRFFNQFQIQER
jgi:hypothetical protein